jgi:hypothetical protein
MNSILALTNSQVKASQDFLKRFAKNFNEKDLIDVMKHNPNITPAGFIDSKNPRYAEYRNYGSDFLQQFQLACAFLNHCPKTRSINYKNSHSYLLKHRLENFVNEYIPNGAILSAAELLNIDYVRESSDSPNVWLAISKTLSITDEMVEIAHDMKKAKTKPLSILGEAI